MRCKDSPERDTIVIRADSQHEAFETVAQDNVLENTNVQLPLLRCRPVLAVGDIDEVLGDVVRGKGFREAESSSFEL